MVWGIVMLIINKNKHFNRVTEDLFNMAMADIRELNLLLTPCGAKPLIEKDKEKFVTVTFLYVLFFQESALQKKYYPKYKREASVVIDAMLYQIAERFRYDPKKLTDIYLDVRKMLDGLSNDSEVVKAGLYYGVAIHFLQYAFSGEYDIEDSIYDDDTPYVRVGQFFQEVVNSATAYLT